MHTHTHKHPPNPTQKTQLTLTTNLQPQHPHSNLPFIIQNSHSVTLINTPQNALYYHNFSNIITIIILVFKQNKTKRKEMK